MNNNQKELEVIFDLRCSLLEIYSDVSDFDKYIVANELLNDLEKIVRDREEK